MFLLLEKGCRRMSELHVNVVVGGWIEKLQILFPVQNSCGILLQKLLSKGVPLEKINRIVRHVGSSTYFYCWKKGGRVPVFVTKKALVVLVTQNACVSFPSSDYIE